jgi:hypothetical protein
MIARLRDRSSDSHTPAGFSAAGSGVSTFPRAASSSSRADLGQWYFTCTFHWQHCDLTAYGVAG